MESIPKKLLSEYIIHNETIKYATYNNEEFEKHLKDEENITEKTLIDNINELIKSVDEFKDKFLKIIKNDKVGINKYMIQINMKGVEYIIVSKIFKVLLEELLNKLNNEKTIFYLQLLLKIFLKTTNFRIY